MLMSCSCENKLESNFSSQKVDLSLMEPVFRMFEGQNASLISILQETQGIYGYLPLDALKVIAERTGNKKAKIYGIATFYSQFRLKPTLTQGEHLCLPFYN